MEMKITAHIDLVLAGEVAAGRTDFRTKVGQLRIQNPLTGKVEWQNAYVHFEFSDGAPRISEKGKLRMNFRPQKDHTAQAAKPVEASTAQQVQDDLQNDLPY